MPQINRDVPRTNNGGERVSYAMGDVMDSFNIIVVIAMFVAPEIGAGGVRMCIVHVFFA